MIRSAVVPPYVPDPAQRSEWTGQQYGAFYALTALALGEAMECRTVLAAILDGKWDDYGEEA